MPLAIRRAGQAIGAVMSGCICPGIRPRQHARPAPDQRQPVRLYCVETSERPSKTMSDVTLDIKRWGNSLGVRLPAAVARAARLREDQRVRISVEGTRVVIEPLAQADDTLAARLARFDPARHGGEAMATGPLGVERF